MEDQTVNLASILFLFLAVLFFCWGWRERQRTGLPTGKVVTLDLHDRQRLQTPLFSKRYRLTGQPDYLIQRGKEWIPVEVKTVGEVHQPYESHIFQLLAYCLLVEEHYGYQHRDGYLHYRSRFARDREGITYQIEYTPERRKRLIDLLGQMHSLEQVADIDRSHQEVARCRGCGYASLCDQKL